MTTVAIMQPTYLPWIGYFAMMDRVDVFVLLDTVQFSRRSWQQRNRIKLNGREHMLTVPVLSKGQRDQPIHSAKIDKSRYFAAQHMASLRHAYAKAPFFQDHQAALAAILETGHDSLSALNRDLILWLRDTLGIKTPVMASSSLKAEGTKAELLAAICNELEADHFIAAPASEPYMSQANDFELLKIDVSYHAYNHPVYSQGSGDFLPYMAVIDLLFHAGPQGLSILRSGVGDPADR